MKNNLGILAFYKARLFNSLNVKNEVDIICFRNISQYKSFLFLLARFFSKFCDNCLINELEAHELIDNMESIGTLQRSDMHHALNKIWVKLNFNINHEAFDVKNKFSIFQNDFQSLHLLKKEHIFDSMSLIANHTKDEMILEKIQKEKLKDNLLHGEDENILFDANEFCLKNRNLNLKFVSADQDFFKAITILKDYLCFDECINLMDT